MTERVVADADDEPASSSGPGSATIVLTLGKSLKRPPNFSLHFFIPAVILSAKNVKVLSLYLNSSKVPDIFI